MPSQVSDQQSSRIENYNRVIQWGLSEGFIFSYDDKLMEKLRNIYEGGIPASLILLSTDMFSDAGSYRALLLARALMDEEEDIEILYLENNSIKDCKLTKHCVVERTTKDGKHYIYDTYNGLMFDRKMYKFVEDFKVIKTMGKDSIIAYMNQASTRNPDRFLLDENAIAIAMPILEKSLEREPEDYEKVAKGLLKAEIEYFKDKINYKRSVNEDESGNGQTARVIK